MREYNKPFAPLLNGPAPIKPGKSWMDLELARAVSFAPAPALALAVAPAFNPTLAFAPRV